MYYNGLYDILEGLNKDYEEIVSTINDMEKETLKNNDKHDDKSVKIGHNGTSLVYALYSNDIEVNGKISLDRIYSLTRGKHGLELANVICDIIESDAINKYFSI